MRWMGFITFCWLTTALQAADPIEFAATTIEPLLRAKCLTCHGPDKQEGNLRLDSRAAALQGGDSGPALVAGNAEQSLLLKAVRGDDPDRQMPPKEPLSREQVAALTEWIQAGAVWPEPVTVLFEDEPEFITALVSGDGQTRAITDGVHGGQLALGVTSLQRFAERIPGWNFPVRETPQAGESRYLQLAWKKSGAGAVMIELATHGQWPAAQSAPGRYVAGPNSSEWAAVSLSPEAPAEWTVVTIDLWKELGDTVLTGIAPTCLGAGEAAFDSIVLGPTLSSVAAYRPGAGQRVLAPGDSSLPAGDAFTDANNPVRQLWQGERLDLWSWKPPVKAPVPTIEGVTSAHPVDRFVAQSLSAAQLSVSPPADRRTLIRRLTIDLTGLPPTLEAVAAFVASNDPLAYETLVDRLLASPEYGERQARLWLDVVRYADTHGYERDEFRPLAWKYRDYVVRAFQQDKPFDRFVLEQLAGDELVAGPPADAAEADALIATGYLQLGAWDSTASIFQEADRLRAEEQADLTNTTASAFLGLTMSCCQCHEHKYDPLLQADHYRLRAFFAGVQRRDDLVIELPAERMAIEAHNAALSQSAQPLKDEFAKLDPEKESDKARHQELQTQIRDMEGQQRTPQVTMGATDRTDPPATHLFYQGDVQSPKQEVAPGFVSLIAPGPARIEPPRPETTGRRLALARWIVAPDNPWTARVFVNRIWQQHFGHGLVGTPNDLGYSGARPTHPELLDWLAIEFIEQGWSVKQLHRLIVTSATYQQQSRERPEARSIDPDNRLLWRQNVQRMDAETLRDSLLQVAGLLNHSGGGKPRWPAVPEELLYAQPGIQEALKGEDGGRMQGWFTDPVEQTDVRSLYLVRKRCLPIPFLQAFDLPDTVVSCARRDTTVVAPQALMLLNSDDGVRYARALAERVAKTTPTDGALWPTEAIQQVFRLALGRDPSVDEQRLSEEFWHAQVAQQTGKSDSPDRLALAELCRAILNLNEFAYYD